MSLEFIAIVFSAAAAFCSAMVLFNLRSITKRVESLESDQKVIHREYVPAENWVRSETYTRQKLDRVLENIAQLDGKLQVAEKMPEIAGVIAREIAGQMKGPPTT